MLGLSFSAFGIAEEVAIATVGKKPITLKAFQTKIDDIRKQTVNPPTPSEFLEDLVRFEVGVQEAEKKNLQNDPLVQERIRQELYKALVEKAIGEKVSKIKVVDGEMQKYYQKYPEIRTSHILIEVKPNATEEEKKIARERGEQILKEVKESKRPFEDLAKLYSDDSLSKNSGGDIGYQSRVTLVPPYYDAAIKLKQDSVDGLFPSQHGYHIIKFTGRRNYEQANKRQIRAAVFDEKRKVIFDQYFKNLKSQYKIEVNQDLLSKVK